MKRLAFAVIGLCSLTTGCLAESLYDPFRTRVYAVLPTLPGTVAETSAAIQGKEDAKEAVPGSPDLQEFFRMMGVHWPEGSFVRYIPSISRLAVRNTPHNLRIFESILDVLNVTPVQIEVEVQFVEFERSDVSDLAKDGIIDAESLKALRGDGKGVLLAAPKVITPSGVEACLKGVEGYCYPTGLKVSQGLSTNDRSKTQSPRVVIEPADFERKETGVVLSVLPDVSPDGSTISVTMLPERTVSPQWERSVTKYTDPKGKEWTAQYMQPAFHSQEMATSIKLCNGATVLSGGGVPSRDKKKLLYFFVTARLVDLAGKPLPVREQAKEVIDVVCSPVPDDSRSPSVDDPFARAAEEREDKPLNPIQKLRRLNSLDGSAIGPDGSPGSFFRLSMHFLGSGSKPNFFRFAEDDNCFVAAMGLFCLAQTDREDAVVALRVKLTDRRPFSYFPKGCVGHYTTLGGFARELLRNRDCLMFGHAQMPLLPTNELAALDIEVLSKDECSQFHHSAASALKLETIPLKWPELQELCPRLSQQEIIKGIGRAGTTGESRIFLISCLRDNTLDKFCRLAAGSALTRNTHPEAKDALKAEKSFLNGVTERSLGDVFLKTVEKRMEHEAIMKVVNAEHTWMYQERIKDTMIKAFSNDHPLALPALTGSFSLALFAKHDDVRRAVSKSLLRISDQLDRYGDSWNTYSDTIYILDSVPPSRLPHKEAGKLAKNVKERFLKLTTPKR